MGSTGVSHHLCGHRNILLVHTAYWSEVQASCHLPKAGRQGQAHLHTSFLINCFYEVVSHQQCQCNPQRPRLAWLQGWARLRRQRYEDNTNQQPYRYTEKLGLGRLGPQMEKHQDPEAQCICYIELNRER